MAALKAANATLQTSVVTQQVEAMTNGQAHGPNDMAEGVEAMVRENVELKSKLVRIMFVCLSQTSQHTSQRRVFDLIA